MGWIPEQTRVQLFLFKLDIKEIRKIVKQCHLLKKIVYVYFRMVLVTMKCIVLNGLIFLKFLSFNSWCDSVCSHITHMNKNALGVSVLFKGVVRPRGWEQLPWAGGSGEEMVTAGSGSVASRAAGAAVPRPAVVLFVSLWAQLDVTWPSIYLRGQQTFLKGQASKHLRLSRPRGKKLRLLYK